MMQDGVEDLLVVENTSRRANSADLHLMETWALEQYMPRTYHVQITVHLDTTYAWQSSAKLEVWSMNDLSWHLVCFIMPEHVSDLEHTANELRARAAILLDYQL